MFRRRFRKQNRGCGGGRCRRASPLSELSQDASAVILSNHDKQTLEMGMFPGVAIRVLKNRPANPSVVVAAGDSRYIISRQAAMQIEVRR
jgi:Fe2+ transport system protein FeoA